MKFQSSQILQNASKLLEHDADRLMKDRDHVQITDRITVIRDMMFLVYISLVRHLCFFLLF